ncbi:MAG: response regulator transcription factor [Gammaproteobacteria bacterium]|nr:response regulator transcription factor [Gammaproteobacteria bacterium]
MYRLLLIDDDSELASLLRQYFTQFDFELDNEILPSQGLALLQRHRYDLVILDIMLPEMDGFEVCKRIRKHSDIPIIMLTARGEVMDRIVGLELGADDYLPKPFEPRELVARIQRILKRSQFKRADEIGMDKQLSFGRLRIDSIQRQVQLDEEIIALSAMEYKLLLLFASSPHKIFTRDELLNQLKGIDAVVYTRSIDILVSRLRNKLKPLDLIKTIRGQGYLFVGNAS